VETLCLLVRNRELLLHVNHIKVLNLFFSNEPTSSLEKIIEIDFVEAISALPKQITLVITSYREEFFSVCNKFCKLENQRLKEERKG
jgi:ABC-type multidrug transport system ATPase subunit